MTILCLRIADKMAKRFDNLSCTSRRIVLEILPRHTVRVLDSTISKSNHQRTAGMQYDANAADDMPPQRNFRDQVLGIAELLDMILCELPTKDVSTVRLVNKDFKTAVDDSHALSVRRFMKPGSAPGCPKVYYWKPRQLTRMHRLTSHHRQSERLQSRTRAFVVLRYVQCTLD